MFSLKSLWKPWSGDASRPPERDEHMMIADSILLELECHMREQQELSKEKEAEERRKQTGVDYTWLVSSPAKVYEIPQLEKLELEDLCYRVKPTECGKVITLFRDSLLNEPKAPEMPRILKACIHQVLDHRPKEESLTDWVKTVSLANLRLRPVTKVAPSNKACDEMESCSTIDTVSSLVDSDGPHMVMHKASTLPLFSGHGGIDSLPV